MIPVIQTEPYRFRVGGPAKRKQIKGVDATTRDGRPVWLVRLTAIDDARRSSETIWVEVPGDEPTFGADDQVLPVRLVYTPWVNRKGEIVRAFRADQITPADPTPRKSA